MNTKLKKEPVALRKKRVEKVSRTTTKRKTNPRKRITSVDPIYINGISIYTNSRTVYVNEVKVTW